MLANPNSWFHPDPSCLFYSPCSSTSDQSTISFGSAGQGSPGQAIGQLKSENKPLGAPSSATALHHHQHSQITPITSNYPASQHPPNNPHFDPTNAHLHHHPNHHNHHQQLAHFVQNALGIPASGGVGGGTTPAMERPRAALKKKPRPVPEERKDSAYRERRKKNNDSARRSREQRRRKEEETQQRNAELEADNARLRQENHCFALELVQLRQFYEQMVAAKSLALANGAAAVEQQRG